MRVIGHKHRAPKWRSRLLLLLFVVIIAMAGLGVLERDFLRKVRHDPRGMLVEAPRNYLQARARAPRLDVLQIHMKFKHYEKILERREEALRVGILQAQDGDEVPAELESDGKTIPVKMRLKGDWPDHFKTDKWSYRVKTKKGEYYRGMRRFSLQHPEAREYLGEWLFLKTLRREGILAPYYGFVSVVFNGESKGIFALEEHFAKELLERQGRREAPIAKFDEDPYWEQRRISRNEHGMRWFDLDYLSYQNADVSFFGEASLLEDPVLSQQMLAARSLLEGFQSGELSSSEVFEVDAMARFLALCRVFGADHALIWHNLRFYYDPVTARLEPIGFDGEPSGWTAEDKVRTHLVDGFQLSMGLGGWFPWIAHFLEDDAAMETYLGELWRYTSPQWSEGLVAELGDEMEALLFALRLEWPRLQSPLPALRDGQNYLRGKLDLHRPLRARYRLLSEGMVELTLGNLSDVPREAVAVLIDGERVELEPPLRAPARPPLAPIPYRHRELRLAGTEEFGTLEVLHRTIGVPETETSEPAEMRGATPLPTAILPEAPDPRLLAQATRWLDWDPEAATLIVLPGDWAVQGDLILPLGVETSISPGTTLRFAAEAILLARGALQMRGTAEAPVRLLPQEGSWGSLVLMGSASPSEWDHVLIQGTTSLSRPGWVLPGGVTIQDAPIQLRDCRFEGHRGEDALNIMQTSFLMERCVIGDCPSDAFDGDFVEGSLVDCSFHDVEGDAIDFSGSTIEIRGFSAARIGDKAISAGEESELRISDFRIDGATIGIAAKDLSNVVASDGVLSDLKIGLAAYTKKPSYGPAMLVAENLEFTDCAQLALVHTESLVRLDGVNYESSEFDVKELYRLGVLGN